MRISVSPQWKTSIVSGSSNGWRRSSQIDHSKPTEPRWPEHRAADSAGLPSSLALLVQWRAAQRVLRHLAIGSPEHSEVVERIGSYRRAYLEAIREARQDHRPEPPLWPMMSPRSQSSLPIMSIEIGGGQIAIESGWLKIVEQESGRRDWRANVLFEEIRLDRRGGEEVAVVIATPSGTLSGRAVITGGDPFGMTLAAAPGAPDTWESDDSR
jgi:hypothetical protein